MKNAVLREIPEQISGYRSIRPFSGAYDNLRSIHKTAVRLVSAVPGSSKLLPDIRAALLACGLKSGATISFHHHLRNGDQVLNAVLAEIEAMGLNDIKVAASSVFPVHAPLIEHFRRGVVTALHTTYIAGPVGKAIACGSLAAPVVMCTHGGRARAIEAGDLHIDVAFVAAPEADCYGNINGVGGRSAFGTLGYAMTDVAYADRVVVITDHLVPYPACPIDISQDYVDFVVPVNCIGDPEGIVSGSTRALVDPIGLQVAKLAAQVVEASGLLVDGFSFQTGAGGISLAVASELKSAMKQNAVRGSFAAGGITAEIVEMLEAGLFRALFDVQCFDLIAVDSYRRNAAHQSMSASMYANPHNRGAVVNKLDVMILGATEIDRDFNVNVTTGTDGVIMGGAGGHSDTAAGAKLALVTTRLTAGGYPKIVERVTTVTTPGETIDVLVTDGGVAVNPRRAELKERLLVAGLPIVEIEALKALSEARAGKRDVSRTEGSIVAVVEYRDGTVIDVVRAIL